MLIVVATQLLTPKQVCERLAVSRRTLQRLTDERLISFVRVGGQVRFRESVVELYVTKEEIPAIVVQR